MSLDVDQATVDRWLADGRWVVVEPGDWKCERCGASFSLPLEMTCDDHHPVSIPPAWMVEAAKPCETCDGVGSIEGRNIASWDLCPDCSNGKRRFAITVPCDECDKGHVTCPKCGNYYEDEPGYPDSFQMGRLAVAHAAVEWGPLRVRGDGRADSQWPGPHVEIIGSSAYMWTSTASGDCTNISAILPPASDPQSLIGRWAIGGSIEGRDGSIPSPVLGGHISPGFDSPSDSRAALEGEAGNGSRPDRQQHGGSIEVAS